MRNDKVVDNDWMDVVVEGYFIATKIEMHTLGRDEMLKEVEQVIVGS